MKKIRMKIDSDFKLKKPMRYRILNSTKNSIWSSVVKQINISISISFQIKDKSKNLLLIKDFVSFNIREKLKKEK